MSNKILAAAMAKGPFDKLNKELGFEGKTYSDKNPFLKSYKDSIEDWWNNLTHGERHEVGALALHFGYMSANYPWVDGSCTWMDNNGDWEHLTKGQKKRVEQVINRRDDKSSFIDMVSALNL